MPQEFQVLQCYQCQTFQVHQVKKAIKWSCKLCGEKQSIKKVFGRGTGFECRQHVQTLNMMQGQLQSTLDTVQENDHSREEWTQGTVDTQAENITQMSDPGTSKWIKYVEHQDNTEVDEVYTDDEDSGDLSAMYTSNAAAFKSAKHKGPRENKRKKNEIYGQTTAGKWAKYYTAEETSKKDTIWRSEDTEEITLSDKSGFNHISSQKENGYNELSEDRNIKSKWMSYIDAETSDTHEVDTLYIDAETSDTHEVDTNSSRFDPSKELNISESKGSKWGKYIENHISVDFPDVIEQTDGSFCDEMLHNLNTGSDIMERKPAPPTQQSQPYRKVSYSKWQQLLKNGTDLSCISNTESQNDNVTDCSENRKKIQSYAADKENFKDLDAPSRDSQSTKTNSVMSVGGSGKSLFNLGDLEDDDFDI